MNIETQNLINLGHAYALAKGFKLSTVGAYFANSGSFFKKLDAGKSVTVSKYHRLLQDFSNNWPSDLEWPPEIPRPEVPKPKTLPLKPDNRRDNDAA